MFTRLAAIVAILFCAVPAFAQLPWQFHWQKGQTLTYKIKHVTSVVETLEKGTNMSQSQLDLINRWEIADVDAKGIATLNLTLLALRNEQKRANGGSLLFDSAHPEKSTPELREQMGKLVGQTLAVVRLDSYGRVIEVTKGNAASFDSEPPFHIVFPEARAAVGQAWKRPFTVVLDPPYGTGEKLQADQRYECKKIDGALATLEIKTEFKTMPDNAREQLPLLQKDVEGDLVVDLQKGRLMSAHFRTDKTIENHQGKGSSYQFKSQYSRVLIE